MNSWHSQEGLPRTDSHSGYSMGLAHHPSAGTVTKVDLGVNVPSTTNQAASRKGPQGARPQAEGQERELKDRIPALESLQPAGEGR